MIEADAQYQAEQDADKEAQHQAELDAAAQADIQAEDEADREGEKMEVTMNDQASQMAKTWQETVLSDAQILAATEGIGSVFPVQNAYQLQKYLKKQAQVTWEAAMADREAAVKAAEVAGMVKVIEWVEANKQLWILAIDVGFGIRNDSWQTFILSLNLPLEALAVLEKLNEGKDK